MDNVRPTDKDATLGLDQGYRPLHVRLVQDEGFPCVESHWRPTAQELFDLFAGGVVVVRLLGTAHPPVKVETRAKDTPPC